MADEIIPGDAPTRRKAFLTLRIAVLVFVSLPFISRFVFPIEQLTSSDNPATVLENFRMRALIILVLMIPLLLGNGIWHLRYALRVWRERTYPPNGVKVPFATRVRRGVAAQAWSIPYFAFSLLSFITPLLLYLVIVWSWKLSVT
jgi:hypothetical protein